MIKQLLGICIVAIVLTTASCKKQVKKDKDVLFSKLSSDLTGIEFSNDLIETDTFNIIFYEFYYNGSGVSSGDLNNDGLADLFFGGNMESSKLYLNKGNFKFEDITKSAGINTKNKWVTGVNFVDINADGWLDIYLSVAGNIGADYTNLFYISNGNAEDLKFEERAVEMGLNDKNYSTQSAFFDYDNDGDLDMYLVTSAMDIPNKNRVRKLKNDGSMRNTDQFYRNDGIDPETKLPKFTNVSKEAGVLAGGFGLGVSVTDINQDGWTDIYIANDYISNDLLYINQKNGTFKNESNQYFKYSSYSAMGSDIADINNDGLVDLVAVDMLPPDNYRKKIMAGAGRSYNRYLIEKKVGYYDQYIRNTLQINNGDNTFSELGQIAGVHETDWSWAPVLADFDNDGLRDLFIANGIPQDITNMDFVSYQANQSAHSMPELLKELHKKGTVKIANYMFKNNGDVQFEDVTKAWGFSDASFSNSAVYVDLDNDGDLDIVTNNINDKAFVYRNNLAEKDTTNSRNYLQLSLMGEAQNTHAIGAEINIYYNNQRQYYEHYPTRGFLSTQDYKVHFGLGENTKIDSLIVRWANKKGQKLYNIASNQLLTLKQGDAVDFIKSSTVEKELLFKKSNEQLGIDYVHKEVEFNDFNIQPLLPHQFSKEGAGVAVADVNGDSLQDFYVGGATSSSGVIYYQQNSGKFIGKPLDGENKYEDMGVLFFDVDNDGDQDLYVVSGGSGLPPGHPMYRDRLYINNNGKLILNEAALPDIRVCGSKVTASDFDKDGDLDLFIGGRVNLEKYPLPPQSTLLLNESKNGKVIFRDITSSIKDLSSLGMVSDALWTDFDNDGWQDLIVVGEWMPITLLKNEKGMLKNVTSTYGLDNSTGWWNSLTAADFDKDGDIDYVVGNLGLNTRFKASETEPLEIYAKDFDNNGFVDPVITYYIDGVQHPIYGRDLLFKQLSYLQNRFQGYEKYSKAPFSEIFTKGELQNSYHADAKILTSVFIENQGNKFVIKALPYEAQVAPVFGLLTGDYGNNGTMEVLGIGNSYSSDVETGHYGALTGLNLKYQNGNFANKKSRETGFIVNGDGKGLAELSLKNGNRLIIAVQNNEPLVTYTITSKDRVIKAKDTDAYAIITYKNGKKERKEFYYGGGYLSHSSRSVNIPKNVTSVKIFDYSGKERVINLNN